jgi:hypothetical protein
MKSLAKMFILGVAAISFAACSNNTQQAQGDSAIKESGTRGGAQIANLKGQEVAIALTDIIIVKKQMDAAADAAVANKAFQNAMAAEGMNTMSDVKLVANEKSEAGMFVFSLEAQQSKKITFQMYDEEGFAMAANNTINLNAGKNYKAVNVSELANGTYKMYLKDGDGKEIVSKVVVENEK